MARTKGTNTLGSKPKNRKKFKNNQSRAAYLMIAPTMILFFVFMIIPIIMSLYLSFTSYDIINEMRWVGLANYRRLLTDNILWTSFKNVAILAVFSIPLNVIISLIFAIIVTRDYRGTVLFRVAYYMPAVTSAVAASIVWMWLLNAEYGLVNELLGFIGISGPAWLAQTWPARVSIILVGLWLGVGGNMIIYMAGIKGIPDQLYEAAEMDGASSMQKIMRITVPMLKPTTLFISTMSIIGALQIFDQAYVLTRGGPANSTKTVVYHIYTTGFEQLQMGYASAQSFVLAIFIMVFTLINFKFSNRD